MKSLHHFLARYKVLFFSLATALIVSLSWAFSDSYFEISKHLDIFTTLFKEVNMNYVDETEPGELIDEAIESMLESLDPYTNYISESEIEDFRFQTTGQYGGIGAIIRKRDDYVIISEPYEGFPADKAGLIAGDKILEIDGKSVKEKSTEDVSDVLKGSPGTEVILKIERNGEEMEKKINREEIQVKSVPYYGMLNDHIGYITLSSFTNKASKDVKAAYKDLKEKHDLKALVFDLRGNPGGLLVESINVSNIFIEKGQEVVTTKGKLKESYKVYRSLNAPLDMSIPLVVLIDRGSASASEIVSGTIQDLDRGVVVGQRSFGKGLVQQTLPLSYGSQLKITTAKYYTPSGRCIQAIDYSSRNEDGSVGKIPDSLKTAFYTKAGRTVYDGGGVDPDIEVEKEKVPGILKALVAKSLLFDYATVFAREHDNIDSAATFRISDEQYAEFMTFLKDKEYDYETATEKRLEELKEAAEKEEYLEGMKAELEKLQENFTNHKEEDLLKHKDQIKRFLRQEIVSRYYYQEGRMQSALIDDETLEKAIEVLEDTTLYQSVLTVSKE